MYALLNYDEQIKALHLRYIQLNDRIRTSYVDCLIAIIMQNCTIVYLDLSHTNFNQADIIRLNQALAKNHILQHLGNYGNEALTLNPAIDLVQGIEDEMVNRRRIMQLTAKFILLLKYFYLDDDLIKLAALLAGLDLIQMDISLLTLANCNDYQGLYNYLNLYQQPVKSTDTNQTPKQDKGKEKVAEADVAFETKQATTSSPVEDVDPVGNSPTLAALFATENSTISLKYENLNEVAITYREFADLIHNHDNQYSADWINMLVYQPKSQLIKVYPTVPPALLPEYLTPLQQQIPRYAFIPLNVAYQSTAPNHFISLILDRQQQQIFYLNPLNITTIDNAVDLLKNSLGYSKAIVLNTIDFQQSEGEEGWLRHCGMYVTEIFKSFKKAVSLGNEINAQNITTILSEIPCGKAANAAHIRKQHVDEAFAVLLMHGYPSQDHQSNHDNQSVNNAPNAKNEDSAKNKKSKTNKNKQTPMKNDLDHATLASSASANPTNSVLLDSSEAATFNIVDVKVALARVGHTLESIVNHAKLRKGCFYFSTIVPGGIDALGNGCISLAQALTVVKAGRLTFANTDYEFDWQHWSAWLLTTGAGLATIGYFLLNAKENEAFLLKGKVKFSALNLVNYPIQTLLVLLMAIAEGFITVANFGYVMDEVAMPFSDPLIYWLSIGLGLIVGTQFAFMNVNPFAKHLTIKGYTLRDKYDYWQHLQREANRNIPKWRDTLYQGLNLTGCSILGGFINVLPLLSALGRGTLVSAESYALLQYWFSRLVPADEANRLAFGPAATFGLCYTGGHLALHGILYKKFLADTILSCFITRRKLKSPDKLVEAKLHEAWHGLWTTKSTKRGIIWGKRIVVAAPLTGLSVLLPLIAWLIAQGALIELSYMTFFNRPVPVPENSDYSGFVVLTSGHDETVWWLALAFGLPVALEVLAIQSLLLLKLPSLLSSHHKEKKDQTSKAGYHLINHPTPTTAILTTSSYHLKEFVGDVTLASIVGSSKFTLDFLYMPSHTHYYSVGWTQSIISSGVLAITGLCVSLSKLYVNNLTAHNSSTNTVAKAGQLLIKILQALVVGGITVGVEDLFRYLLLDNERGEEEDQLATAQVAGALAGGITWSFLNRVVTPNTTSRAMQWAAGTRVGSSLVAFFTPRRLPSDHGNISINSNPQHAPQP